MKFIYGFVGFTLFVYLGFICFPVKYSQFYHHYVFQSFRIVYDATFGNLPLPFIYACTGVLGFVMIFFFYQIIKSKNGIKHAKNLRQKITKALSIVFVVISVFYWVWGFHYFQPNLKSRWNLSYKEVDSVYLNQQMEKMIPVLLFHRQMILKEEIFSLSHQKFYTMENDLRIELVRILQETGWQTSGKVRVRSIGPEGILLHFSTAGVYIPFVFEGHIDKGLHPLQLPFTVAHEMAHGYGVTDEGDCNTLALLACMHTENSIYIYASLLTYFKYLYYDPRNSELVKVKIFQSLTDIIKQDLVDIKKQSDKFPDLFPKLRDAMYESYLLLMGVEDGLQSYHSLVDKVRAIQEQKQNVLPEWFVRNTSD